MVYQIPDCYYFRIHHVRPRFKSNVESVLLYMAESIAKLPKLPKEEFKLKLNSLIRAFPGNGAAVEKTINNWRTEISSLFGLFESDEEDSWAGRRAIELCTTCDVVEFFKQFLYLFQYPGAHIKPNMVLEQIEHKVRFKPAQYILRIFKAAQDRGISHFGLTKAEVCHLIFNDLRVTSGMEDPEDTLRRILFAKSEGYEYDESGDVIRYAGDILDYMEIANLLRSYNGVFYMNKSEGLIIQTFINSNEWFTGYDYLYGSKMISLDQIKAETENWFAFVNKDLSSTDFQTDLANFFGEDSESGEEVIDVVKKAVQDFINSLELTENVSTKTIGDIGEGIVVRHEQIKLEKSQLADFKHLVRKIPTQFAVGYDVQSFELEGAHAKKYIEVKTTISSKPLKIDRVHLTSNEWNSAQTLKDRYYVYRLQITKNHLNLFVISDPVGLFKKDLLDMTPKDDGAELHFIAKDAGHYEEVLI